MASTASCGGWRTLAFPLISDLTIAEGIEWPRRYQRWGPRWGSSYGCGNTARLAQSVAQDSQQQSASTCLLNKCPHTCEVLLAWGALPCRDTSKSKHRQVRFYISLSCHGLKVCLQSLKNTVCNNLPHKARFFFLSRVFCCLQAVGSAEQQGSSRTLPTISTLDCWAWSSFQYWKQPLQTNTTAFA